MFLYFYPQYLTNGKFKVYQPYHLLEELNRIFQVHLNILPKLWLTFCCYRQICEKWAIFCILKAITLGVNEITDPIFLIYSLDSIRCCILFLYFKTFKIQFHGVPPLHYVLVCKIHIYFPKKTFSSLLT